MYPQRRRMVSQVLGVGLLLTLVVLALSTCGGGGSAQEEKQAHKVHHIPEDSQWYEGKPLPAGHYVTEEFRPTMSFDLDTGWTRGGPELRDAWDIVDIDNDAYWLGFLNAEEVYKPNGSGGLKVALAPEDMVAWVQTNSFLKTEKSTPVSVGARRVCRSMPSSLMLLRSLRVPNVQTLASSTKALGQLGVSIRERRFASS